MALMAVAILGKNVTGEQDLDESTKKSNVNAETEIDLYSSKGLSRAKHSSKDYTPSVDQYFLRRFIPLLGPFKGLVFDGPQSISNAPTKYKTRNKLPTLKQMQYYMHCAGSTYFGFNLKKLDCEYCEKFKRDVKRHEVISDDYYNLLSLVLLSTKNKEIVVAFRGTFNIWNIIMDITTRNIGGFDHNIKLHQGFTKAAKALYDRVYRAIHRYRKEYPSFKIVLCGHSMGGAIARIMYFFFVNNEDFPSAEYELYTYGEPRVGNKAFADFMNHQNITTVRVVARADIVPHVPPTSLLGSKFLLNDHYVHPHTEFWINGKKDQRFCSRTVYEDPKCSMSLGPLYTIVDHLIYFDVNLAASVGQPGQLMTLPFNIFNPVDRLPPLPEKFARKISGVAKRVNRFVNRIFG